MRSEVSKRAQYDAQQIRDLCKKGLAHCLAWLGVLVFALTLLVLLAVLVKLPGPQRTAAVIDWKTGLVR